MSESAGLLSRILKRVKIMMRRGYVCPDCGCKLTLRECGWQCVECKLITSSIDVKNKMGVVGDKRIYESTELKVGKGWLVRDKG